MRPSCALATNIAPSRGRATDAAHDAYEELAAPSDAGRAPREERLGIGKPAEFAALVEEYRDLGAEMVSVPRSDEETVERLADEVMPGFD